MLLFQLKLLLLKYIFHTICYIIKNKIIYFLIPREKFIIEEELGPRLKMRTADARKIITQLVSELLIKSENVYLDADTNRGSYVVCYYVDYQQFVDVVRYRVHLMQKNLTSEEKTELNEVFYQVIIIPIFIIK